MIRTVQTWKLTFGVQQAIRCAAVCAFLLGTGPAFGIGTDAGTSIENTAQVNFEIGGVAQTPVNSNTVQTSVDELIDVTVVDDIGALVGVSSPDTERVLQFTVTNNGNGSETFRLIVDPAVAEGGFDPTIDQLYLESNGIPGLQTGAGGDTPYVSGGNDPTLAEDESVTLYVQGSIGGSLAQDDEGHVEVRAIATTIISESGTDDPDAPAFPDPGDSYAGAGDSGVTAVVGASHTDGNLLIETSGGYKVATAVVGIVKSVLAVVDPFGGDTVVPGSVVTYELLVTVTGGGDAENLVITDALPVELEYQNGTLRIDGVVEDDDFMPLGTDDSGFDTGTQTITVSSGTIAGGAPAMSITFDATIR